MMNDVYLYRGVGSNLKVLGLVLSKIMLKKKKMVNGNFAKKVPHTPLTTPPPVPRPMLYMSTLYTDFIV